MPSLNAASTVMLLLFHCHYQVPQISKLEENNEHRLGLGGSAVGILYPILCRKPVVQLSAWQGLASKSPFSLSALWRAAFGHPPPATLPSARGRKQGKSGCPGSRGDNISTCSDCSSSSSLLGELPGTQIFGANWKEEDAVMLTAILLLATYWKK